MKKTKIIVIVAVAIKFTLHLISDFISGFLGDEFLHIETGNYLSLGYSDFPPMIGIIAKIQNLFESNSIIINRLSVHIAGIIVMLIVAKIIILLGGKNKAMLIGMSTILISPMIWVSHTLFLPMGFNQLFSVLSIYFLLLYYSNQKDRHLYMLAVSLGLGVLTKYSIGIFIVSAFISVLILDRSLFSKKSSWIAVGIFLLIISPNFWWQLNNDFPIYKHFIALNTLDLSKTSFNEMLTLLIKYINPLTFSIGILGIVSLFITKSLKQYRVIGLTLSISIFLIFILDGKFYYILPAIIAAVPFGSYIIARSLFEKKLLLRTIYVTIIISGIIYIPVGLPLFSPEKYVKIYHVKEEKDGRRPIYFDHFHAKTFWNDVTMGVKKEYDNLSEQEQQNCLIWGRHYSFAGLINFYRNKYHLPQAISFMSCYHDWMPSFGKDKIFIAVGEYNLSEKFWHRYFESVEEKRSYRDMFFRDYQNSGMRIFICKGLKYNSDELKEMIDKYGLSY